MQKLKTRLNRDTYFMSLAELTSERGTCPRLRVGCILVSQKKIIATGYNSSHRGTPHCEDIGCLVEGKHCQRTLHAEISAVLNLERSYKNIIAYITHSPCTHCYKVLAAAGVTTIYYKHFYGADSTAYTQLIKEINLTMKEIKYV